MITPFGKFIRKVRIDREVTLNQMANDLNLSPAYLSSVETGKKDPTNKLTGAVCRYFQFNDRYASELARLAEISVKSVNLNVTDADESKRELAATFARRFKELTPAETKKIATVLKGKEAKR